MKKIKVMLYGLCALIAASMTSTPLMAGASDFSGPYIGIAVSPMGAELDGSYTEGTDGDTTKGSGGKIITVPALDLGYNIPLSDTFFVSLGVTYIEGESEISHNDDAADNADVKVEASQFITAYLQPSISVTDNSAIFIKVGYSEADLNITGDFTGTKSDDLEGTTVSMGTKSIFPSGIYFQTEAGITEYDNIFVNDVGTSDQAGGKGDVKADPSLAFGTVTIGYKF